MATYKVSHPELPPEINGETRITTLGPDYAVRDLAAAHVAAILRQRNIRPGVRPQDVISDVSVEEVG